MIAAILAGGKGSRFIPHKSFLKINGETIIEKQLETLNKVFTDIVVVTNNGELYKGLNVRIIADIIPNKGALGGIYSALMNIKDGHCFITASDMPYLNIDLIKYMMDNASDSDVLVSEFNRVLEPLYAFYSKRCILAIEKQIKEDNFKISDLFKSVKVKKISQKVVSKFDPEGMSFTNINTQEDYAHL